MTRASGLLSLAIFAATLSACNSEILQKQAEQIKQQELEIAQQRKDLEAMLASQKMQDQKQQDCNRAFRDYFEKAQVASAGEQAIALYREGLSLCPEDEVAHYELGRALADRGRYLEAEKEFEAALNLRPDFTDARRQLESLRKNR
ncbi:MAG TPA: tetratricopeptide repeat protein [Candidatus Polarisedimenticolaceae bacterium]|nr:tetratricopeptide repeat protein [Candidatus Polarisedimenticolaceae bacterium]